MAADEQHVISSERVYSNPWFAIREDTFRAAGSTRTYAVLDGPDMVMVVPLADGQVCLVEQHRPPVGGRRWEFPSGNVDGADADDAAAAARELREETGLSARSITPLGMLEVLPSTSTQACAVFLATGLTQGNTCLDVEEEGLRSSWFGRDELARMIGEGRLTDARSVAAYALLRADEEGPTGRPVTPR